MREVHNVGTRSKGPGREGRPVHRRSSHQGGARVSGAQHRDPRTRDPRFLWPREGRLGPREMSLPRAVQAEREGIGDVRSTQRA